MEYKEKRLVYLYICRSIQQQKKKKTFDTDYTLPNNPCFVAALVPKATTPPAKHTTPLKMDTSRKPPYFSSMAPLTGGPIKAARDPTANPIPMYVPMFLISSVQIEKAVVAPEMMVPEENPNATEYPISPAVDVAELIHMTTTPVATLPSAKILSLPYLSARTPGITLPNVDAAFRIADR